MSKRKKKPGKQFKSRWVSPDSRAIKKRKGGRQRPGAREEEINRVIPYKSPFFSNE